MNRHLAPGGLCVALLLPWLAGCATLQERVAAREDRLAAAGFVARRADTPQRQAMLQALPPQRLIVRSAGGLPVYLYADPLVCGCLYAGSDAAYGRYRQQMLQQRLADEQPATAWMDPGAAWSLDGWGGRWGPGFGGGFGPGFY